MKKEKKTAIPPDLGMALICTFLSFGISIIFNFLPRKIENGVNKRDNNNAHKKAVK
jgi:hypothetical protein